MALKRLTKNNLPLSFGAFKPVGHVVVAMPDDARADAAIAALKASGFEDEDILYFSAAEEGDQMDHMLEHVSDFAGFGYEVELMRRYQRLAPGCELADRLRAGRRARDAGGRTGQAAWRAAGREIPPAGDRRPALAAGCTSIGRFDRSLKLGHHQDVT